ncbi:glutathione peroxidase [Tistrella bauzanensis]
MVTPTHFRHMPVAALIAVGLMVAMPAGAIPRGASAAAPIGETEGDAMSAYDFTLPAIDGGTIDLGAWAGRPILVVNTASLCGFTPQYEGLVSLWQRYRDQGLMVVGVPSGDFGGQEYDDAARTRDFCTVTYGVDFPWRASRSCAVTPPIRCSDGWWQAWARTRSRGGIFTNI